MSTREMDTDMEQVRARRDELAERIIRRHMRYAVLGASIPTPVLDVAAVGLVHLSMLKELAANYGAPFDSRGARAFVASLASAMAPAVVGAVAGATAARLVASLAKLVPGAGPAAGGGAQVLLTGVSTLALGRFVGQVFREERSLEDLSPSTARLEVLLPLLSTLRDFTEGAAATGVEVLSFLKRRLAVASDAGSREDPGLSPVQATQAAGSG